MRVDRKIVSRLTQLAVIAVVAVVVVTVLGPKGDSTTYRASGEALPLPDTVLEPVNDEDFAGILVGLRGTPVVVNVWASWCAPCRTEMPLLERAAQEFHGRVVFLGVASQDSKRAAREFLDEVGVTYPNVYDRSGEVGRALGQRAFPTTYVFDADGVVRETVVGGVTEAKLAAQLEDLVRG